MAGKPVEMTFEFDSVRNFSSIVLHTNNMFSKDVAVSSPNAFFIIALDQVFECFVLDGAQTTDRQQNNDAQRLLRCGNNGEKDD